MKPNQILELTWTGKGEEPKFEARILIEQPEYSYVDPNTGTDIHFYSITHIWR